MINKRRPQSVKTIISIVVIVVIVLILIFLLWKPSDKTADDVDLPSTDNYAVPTMENIKHGKALALSYCAACHMVPDPALLNRAKWRNVLPQMALRLGIKGHRGELYTPAVKAPDLYLPAKPVLDDRQWQDLVDYYMNTAPRQLPPQNRPVDIERQMPFFSLKAPAETFSGKQVMASMVRIDSSVKPARIFVANGLKHELYLFTNKLKAVDSVKTNGPVVDVLFEKGRTFVCTIGKELGGNSDKFGTVNELQINANGKLHLDKSALFDHLARPVQIIATDINNDGKTDYVICEFGNIKGALCWMESKGDGSFSKHMIRAMPGAIKAYTDYSRNKNAPDLWVLFAQGDEGIWHFINNGRGTFTEQQVLRFPPVYGSSSFEMTDVDGDGFKDIIYTCGDNGDASVVHKPYHGVYLFMNDRHGHYAQKYFYPVNGCYKAYARDFDGDGKIDIAAISLFTDSRQPEEGFVYLKNTGGLTFKPYALPVGTKFERAVTMDEGDINGDGKPDLLIGNAFFDKGPFGRNLKEPLFFILKNNAR